MVLSVVIEDYNSISSLFIKEQMNLYEHTIIARQDTSPVKLNN
jgi:hypothetical protein